MAKQQTRMLQEHVGVILWGCKSSYPHKGFPPQRGEARPKFWAATPVPGTIKFSKIIMTKIKTIALSVVLATVMAIAEYLIFKESLYLLHPIIPIVALIIFPILSFMGQTDILVSSIIAGVIWFFVFILYFKICSKYVSYKFLKYIPIIFVLLIFIPVIFVYANNDSIFTEKCLSGEISKMAYIDDEGAMFCFKNMILAEKLGLDYSKHPVIPTEKAYQDTIKFCASLSNVKLAATNTDTTLGEIVSPNTTYRDYCFIRLADLMASNVLMEKTLGVKSEELGKKFNEIISDNNSDYWNTIRKVCNESSKSSGLQKEQGCLNYFKYR